MLYFLMGLILGGLVGWYFYLSSRREIARLDEEKQMLNQERQIVLEFMHDIAEAIGAGVERRELFQRVVHTAILSTGALSACVFEKTDRDKLVGVAIEGLFPPQFPLPKDFGAKGTTRTKFIEKVMSSEVIELGRGIIGSVAESGRGVLIADAVNDSRIVRHDDTALQVRSMIVTPIHIRERNIGVLAVANPVGSRAFNETDYSIVQSLAEQAGLAIHNADLMTLQIEKNKIETDLSLASSIQGMLLPDKFPDQPSLDIDAQYRPAQKVGGDFYDVFRISEHKIGLVIADVSGKGIPGSLLMAICQSNLRFLAGQYESPARVMCEMNRVLNRQLHKDLFVTLVYGIVDTSANNLTLSRAGHELPLLFHREADTGLSNVQRVGSEGMAVGLVPDELFESVIAETTVPFNTGDIFLLFTDGVTESVNQEGTEFSSERLIQLVTEHCDRPAKDLNQGILEGVLNFTGDKGQIDDITLVTVKHL